MNDHLTFTPGPPLSHAEAADIKLTFDFVNNNRNLATEGLNISLRTLQNCIAEFHKGAKAATTIDLRSNGFQFPHFGETAPW
jgi:hypothetical protein